MADVMQLQRILKWFYISGTLIAARGNAILNFNISFALCFACKLHLKRHETVWKQIESKVCLKVFKELEIWGFIE